METPIEAIREGGQIARALLGEVERVVRPAEAGLEIAQNGVDPTEFRHIFRLAGADDDSLVLTPRLRHSGKTGQTIGRHDAAGGQVGGCPVGNRFEGKAGHRCHFSVERMALGVQGDRRDKGHFILRAPSGFAAREFAAQIDIVHLDLTNERILGLALGHRLHQLVLNEPGGGIADAQLALQGEGGQTGFGLADQIDRQEPNRQRQMSALAQGARDPRGLRAARLALKGPMRSDMEDVIMGVPATRTAKPVGPACPLQRRFALRFGAELLKNAGRDKPGWN